jgi:DNA-binding transcriptional ArsR family regulator
MVKWVLKQDESLDRVFHALADSSRRNMVERLSAGPASVTELARPLPMTLAAVVQHVHVLEAAGLVRTEKVGRVRRCEINLDTLRPVDRWIADRRAMWERAFDQLGSVLGHTPTAHADCEPRSAR